MQPARTPTLFPALLVLLAIGCSKKTGEGAATTPVGETGTSHDSGSDEGEDTGAAAAAAAEQALLALGPTIQPDRPLTEADDPRRTLGASLVRLFARLPVERLAEAAGNLFRLAAKTRETWACHERSERPVVYPAQEELLVGALAVASAVLGSEASVSLKEQARTLVADSLRESPTMQGGEVHRAAADAVFDAAATIDPDDAGRLAPALVEALFIDPLPDPVGNDPQADRPAKPLHPVVRRALVRLALRGDAEREAVVRALLEALAVELGPEQRALPGVDSIEPNDAIALRGLPCGAMLGRVCAEREQALREFRNAGQAPSQAACNRGADPDRPDSGFDWGFEPGRIWETVGDLLPYVLPPSRNGLPPEGSSPTALAVRLLTDQVERAGKWAEEVTAAKTLHDGIAGLYPDLMARRRAGTAVEPRERPAPAPGVQEQLDALHTARQAEPPLQQFQVDVKASLLVRLLRAPQSTPDDLASAAEPLAAVFSDVQSRLLELADFEHGYAAVNSLLWRTIAAARVLGALGLAGPEDRTLDAVLHLARLSSRELMGFRISALQAFPQLVVRWSQRFDAAGQPRVPQPVLPALLDAIGAFQRPTPAVLEFLLEQIGATMLIGENTNATIALERFVLLNADVVTFRALAVRAFLQTFRRAAELPDADRYLTRLRFLVRDVLPLTALEKTHDSDPPVQLWPPDVLAGYATPEPELVVTVPEPIRPPGYSFETYRDALARCVLAESEPREDVARWRREMTDEQKTAYCTKFVEPWASENARANAGVELARMQLHDRRCWSHMKLLHEQRFQYCQDVSRNRTPAQDLGLSRAECRKVEAEDDTYFYCVDLRYMPAYVERGQPTPWGCYDRFPRLRDREPIGPVCSHLAQRILAAWLYVKLRDEAGVATPDGVTTRSLEASLPLEDFLRFVEERAAAAETNPAPLPDALSALVRELAKVQLDFPEFVRPPDAAARTARASVPKPDDANDAAPRFVERPWYRQQGWTTRVPRDFSGLGTDFLVRCGDPAVEAPTECAPNGRLAGDLRARLEGDAPGLLLEDAAALAISITRGDLAGLQDLVAAVDQLAPCAGPSGVDVACADAQLGPAAPGTTAARHLSEQATALYLLTAGASTTMDAAARTALEEPLCRVATLAAEPDSAIHQHLRPVIEFAFLRTRPACGAAAGDADRWNGIWKWILDPTAAEPAPSKAAPATEQPADHGMSTPAEAPPGGTGETPAP